MLRVKNTLTGRKEPFRPIEEGRVRMYVCGPTVYGPGHIGHARTYIAFDIIRRYLEKKGFQVRYVVNITDVHDDMVAQAKKEGVSLKALGDKYTRVFFEDMQRLGVKPATHNPRVTEEIPDIIAFIQRLLDKGHAYQAEDGVYFDITSFKRYGRLSGIRLKAQKTGTRVQTDKYDKSRPQDFALWKKAGEDEPAWDAPWGRGRPGWHIECSLMASKYLGRQLDIHGGAVDLIFPHHENEIAQSEAALGVHPFVRYWLHAGFLNVEGQKMSKSLGNFITIPDLLADYDAKTFRFFIARLHYRSPVDFSRSEMKGAERALQGLNELLARLQEASETGRQGSAPVAAWLEQAGKGFEAAMEDDFNLPNAWAAVFSLARRLNAALDKGVVGARQARAALAFFRDLDKVMGVFSFPRRERLPARLQAMLKEREKLRAQKRFKEADRIREALRREGVEVIDTEEGTRWRRTAS